MGRVTTPTFAVRIFVKDAVYSPTGWPCDRLGLPSDERLARYVQGYEDSTRPGGCNAHVGPETVTRARIIRQATGEIVASYTAPMFSVV